VAADKGQKPSPNISRSRRRTHNFSSSALFFRLNPPLHRFAVCSLSLSGGEEEEARKRRADLSAGSRKTIWAYTRRNLLHCQRSAVLTSADTKTDRTPLHPLIPGNSLTSGVTGGVATDLRDFTCVRAVTPPRQTRPVTSTERLSP